MKQKILILCTLLIVSLSLAPTIAYANADFELAGYYWRKNIYIYSGPSLTNSSIYNSLNNNARSAWATALINTSGYRIYTTTSKSTAEDSGVYARGLDYGA
jgi:hypothetical protein